MALTTRTVTNTGDALVGPDGTVLAGKKITFTLVNANKAPTDAWDVLTGERVAPVKEIATTDAGGLFSVALWPNDRGDRLTYYLCEVNVPYVTPFTAPLPSGALTALQWIDFKLGGNPLSADAYSTPLLLTVGNTLPVSGTLTNEDGSVLNITGYTLSLDVTGSDSVTVNYPIVITAPLTGVYTIDLSALIAGRYAARMRISNASAQTVTGQSFIIVVTP